MRTVLFWLLFVPLQALFVVALVGKGAAWTFCALSAWLDPDEA